MKKKILIAIGLLIAILLVANPTPYDFQTFVGKTENSILRRKENWLVFSIYQINQKHYLGILKNFFSLEKTYNRMDLEKKATAIQDSLRIADSLSLIQS